jgi:hypothetical protein
MSEINWDRILEQMKGTALGQLERAVWRPRLVSGDRKAGASKIGGTPWLAADEDWPACPNCGQIMPLLVQLNLDDLPPSVGSRFGTGLIQAFYCWNTRPHCEVEAEAWDPESTRSKLIRLVQPTGEWRKPRTTWTSGRRRVILLAESLDEPVVPVEDPVSPTCLSDWEEDVDYPKERDATALGVHESTTYLQEAGIGADWEYNFPYNGTKLGGWPYWLQFNEWATCPTCRRPMTQLVFQLAGHEFPSDRGFGDGGNAYLLQCAEHPGQLALVAQS